MPQEFPMPLADFFDKLPISSFTPDLTEELEVSRTRGGEILTANNGPRMWTTEITVHESFHVRIERIKARLQMLRSAGRSLLVHSMPIMYPQSDPHGSIIRNYSITLGQVAPNNRVIRLDGFPPGYKLQVGDFLSFTYGSNPLRYAMHQVVCMEAVADVSGLMWDIEVVDFIRPGYVLGAPVKLIKPIFKAIVVPGSTEVGESGPLTTRGLKFQLLQTLGR